MLQRLPITIGQVKPGNASKRLLNEVKANHIFFVSRKRN